jgi:hypothetical protein
MTISVGGLWLTNRATDDCTRSKRREREPVAIVIAITWSTVGISAVPIVPAIAVPARPIVAVIAIVMIVTLVAFPAGSIVIAVSCDPVLAFKFFAEIVSTAVLALAPRYIR